MILRLPLDRRGLVRGVGVLAGLIALTLLNASKDVTDMADLADIADSEAVREVRGLSELP